MNDRPKEPIDVRMEQALHALFPDVDEVRDISVKEVLEHPESAERFSPQILYILQRNRDQMMGTLLDHLRRIATRQEKQSTQESIAPHRAPTLREEDLQRDTPAPPPVEPPALEQPQPEAKGSLWKKWFDRLRGKR